MRGTLIVRLGGVVKISAWIAIGGLAFALAAPASFANPADEPSGGVTRPGGMVTKDVACREVPLDAPETLEAERAARAFVADLGAGRIRAAFDAMTPSGQSAQSFADFERRAQPMLEAAKGPLDRTGHNYVIVGEVPAVSFAACRTLADPNKFGMAALTTGSPQVGLDLSREAPPSAPGYRWAFYMVMTLDRGTWRVGGLVFHDGAPGNVLGDYPVPPRIRFVPR